MERSNGNVRVKSNWKSILKYFQLSARGKIWKRRTQLWIFPDCRQRVSIVFERFSFRRKQRFENKDRGELFGTPNFFSVAGILQELDSYLSHLSWYGSVEERVPRFFKVNAGALGARSWMIKRNNKQVLVLDSPASNLLPADRLYGRDDPIHRRTITPNIRKRSVLRAEESSFY